MNINLREEETNAYISMYQNYLEDIQRLNAKVNSILNKTMEKTKYDKLQNLLSRIIDTYMETIVNNIETGVFSAWQESDGSLRACLKTYQAGEAADMVCVQIEQKMNELMRDILKIEKADIVVTERPIVSEEGLEKLENICKSAQTEILELKEDYLSHINNKTDENDLYGTLRPLVEGVSINMEAFFDASLQSFENLHNFIRGISLQLHNIVEENGVTAGREGKNDAGLINSIGDIANLMGRKDGAKPLESFKKLTELLYNTINDETNNNEKKLTYSLISKMMPIYHKFYKEYGQLLKDDFSSLEKRYEYVMKEYIQVTRQRNNEQFFEEEELWIFKSHAHKTYTVFDKVANMVNNIVLACQRGNANDVNLLYGSYVLFMPIIQGHIDSENSREYTKFCKWAAEEITKLLEEKTTAGESVLEEQEEEITFEGKKFSDVNIKLFVKAVEAIINQVGERELNISVVTYYNSLSSSRQLYSKKAKADTTKKYDKVSNIYGRYTVTKKSIQLMKPIYEQTNSILERIDKFYKEKFQKLGKRFDTANKVIHEMSSFIGLWGLGTWDLSEMFSTDSSDKSILEKVKLGKLALVSCTTAGRIINGGAHLVKILDWAMPHLKKSKILVKLNEKVWNLTRQDIQIPYVQKMMDQYMMEHYEIKYGMTKRKNLAFEYYHSVATEIEKEHHRRAFENSIFSAETMLTPQNYIITELNPKKNRAICCGVFLNLVRSGMCSKQDIESGTANEIVDKLYDIYVSKEMIEPRVDIDPGKRRIL